MKKLAVTLLAAVSSLFAMAEWIATTEGNKNYLGKDGWKLEYSVLSNGISIHTVAAWGTSTSLDFSTIQGDTGLTVRKLGGFKKNTTSEGFITSVTFPNTIVEILSDGFKCHPIANDLNFTSNPVIIGSSAFYGHRAAAVRITQPGSVIGDSAFSAGDNLTLADIRGVCSLGNSAFSRGSNYSLTEAIISTCLTNISNQAFNQQRNMILTVLPPSDPDSVYTGDATIGTQAFRDCGATAAKHELVIPFRGKCIIGSQVFNWMQNTTNFVFWGKVPTIASDAFNSCSALNEKSIITCCPDVDSDWLTFGQPLDTGDEAKAGFPKNGQCFRKYVNSGTTFWVCRGESPYSSSGPGGKPRLGECSVVKNGSGFTVSGTVDAGVGRVYVRFGNDEFAVTDTEATGPFSFSKNIAVTDAAGGLYSDTSYAVTIVATNSTGKSSAWQNPSGIYTGDISVTKLGDAAEQGLVANYFRISRANTVAAKANSLMVLFSLTGTAQAGADYVEIPLEAEIPAGEDHVDVRIMPRYNSAVTVDTQVTLTIVSGAYGIGTASSTMTIQNGEVDPNAIYVDGSVAANGNGSFDNPFKTIKAAANAATSGKTIYVRGGQTYTFADCNDNVEIAAAKTGVAIRGCDASWGLINDWAQTNDMPLIAIANNYASLSYAINNGYDAPIALYGADSVVSGLKFTFAAQSYKAQNLGGSGLINVYADNALVESCAFFMTSSSGSYQGAGTAGVIRGEGDSATNCKVRKCYAWLGKYRAEVCLVCALRTGAEISECFLENIDELFGTFQASGVYINIISNVFLNCSSKSGTFESSTIGRGGNGYPAGGEIAYNRAIHNDGSTGRFVFFEFAFQYNSSWYGDTKIHHNTIVGYDAAFSKPKVTGDVITPKIFDNLIVIPGGTNLVVEATGPFTYKENNITYTFGAPFKLGSEFRCNALLADAFGGGSMMTANAGMDIFESLGYVDTTFELTSVPEFINTTDPRSPNYYRVRVRQDKFLSTGGCTYEEVYPKYIGALPPMVMGCGAHVFIF